MGIWIYIRVYTILAYSVVFKHIKYDIQNLIMFQTLLICTGLFFREKNKVLALSWGYAPFGDGAFPIDRGA